MAGWPREQSTTRRVLFRAAISVMAISVLAWFFTRDTLPRRVRIASGASGGLYYQLAKKLGEAIEQRAGVEVEILETAGSTENRDRILAGEAELAILQEGPRPIDGVARIVPLYDEPVLVLAHDNGSAVESIRGLAGRRVIVGSSASGMYWSALTVLDHYGIEVERDSRYFNDFVAVDEPADAAIVTTGILNPDLGEFVKRGNVRVLEIEDSEAIAARSPFLRALTLPRGVLSGQPSVPASTLRTVATTAILAAPEGVTQRLVDETLAALYGSRVRAEFPILISDVRARSWEGFLLHTTAVNFFDPYGGIGLLANLVETLSGVKELAFALLAGLYLVRDRIRRSREAEREREVAELKERLDRYLEETIRVERAQMETTEVGELKRLLDEVTTIKLSAIEELTHEALRGDSHFAIFLAQCANLIGKIQAKIAYQRPPLHEREDEAQER